MKFLEERAKKMDIWIISQDRLSAYRVKGLQVRHQYSTKYNRTMYCIDAVVGIDDAVEVGVFRTEYDAKKVISAFGVYVASLHKMLIQNLSDRKYYIQDVDFKIFDISKGV